jgi:polyadenylate-binding protein 2
MSTTEDIHSDHIEDGDADNEVRSPSPSVSDRVQDVETMQARLAELEAEAQKIREMQESVDKEHNALSSQDKREDVDARSVFVGNVDYSATPEDLQAHFASCGTILRVTILCDKITGHPKGFAYIEFQEPSLVPNALVLNETQLKGRTIKVTTKRTNIPFMNRGRGRGGFRARGFRGRGGFRGGYRGGRGRGYTPY